MCSADLSSPSGGGNLPTGAVLERMRPYTSRLWANNLHVLLNYSCEQTKKMKKSGKKDHHYAMKVDIDVSNSAVSFYCSFKDKLFYYPNVADDVIWSS